MEEPLPAGGSCCLCSINLAQYVLNPFTEDAVIDVLSLAYDTSVATRAINTILQEGIHLHPLQEQRESVDKWKQIGLTTRSIKIA